MSSDFFKENIVYLILGLIVIGLIVGLCLIFHFVLKSENFEEIEFFDYKTVSEPIMTTVLREGAEMVEFV